MKGLTNYITESLWEDILIALFVLVDDSYRALDPGVLPKRKCAPPGSLTFGDSEVITLSLFGEMIFAGDESKTLHFIRQYHLDLFARLLDNGRFNRRKRHLAEVMEAMRCQMRDRWRLAHPLDPAEAHLRLVDSAPISICTYSRGSRCQSIPIDERDAWFGVCNAKKTKFFGPRCHLLSCLDQMIDTWLLAPGSLEDRQPLIPLLEDRHALALLADKGYVSQDLEDRLWAVGEHLLLALKRDNQLEPWPAGIQAVIGRLRHRVETTFSVLTTVFDFERPRSRSFSGMLVRLTAKILAHTVSFFLAETLTPHLSN